MHPAFQEVLRRLYLLPTKLSMTALHEHADLVRAAKGVQEDTGTAIAFPRLTSRFVPTSKCSSRNHQCAKCGNRCVGRGAIGSLLAALPSPFPLLGNWREAG